jgi:transcriptional regulator GlxA family with amidase domain
MPACTDAKTRPFLEAKGVKALDVPFHAEGNIATAGGCLASQYLAAWTITRTLGEDAARAVIDYVAPYGENEETVERAMRVIGAGTLRA